MKRKTPQQLSEMSKGGVVMTMITIGIVLTALIVIIAELVAIDPSPH